MKVLIVSFDKTLTESLKEAFSDHEVFIAKNSEEAIKMIPSDIEVVVYDAISGAISEEDINTLYTKKFSNAKYIILYDELFPVDMNNIIAPAKMMVPRDESPQNISAKLTEAPPAEVPAEIPSEPAPSTEEPEMEIEPTSLTAEVQEVPAEPEMEIEPSTLDVEEVAEEAAKMASEIEATQETPPAEVTAETTPSGEPATEPSPAPPPPQETPVAEGGGKVLIVSFDQTLIDSIKSALGGQYEVVSVKTVRQAIQQGTDASVVVFDAISGVIAEKGLIDMANDQYMKNKPYIILVDDLFPINVENIPLEKKDSVSRDTDPSRIKEFVAKVAAPAPAEAPAPSAPEPEPQPPQPEPQEVVEEIPPEPVEEVVQELETVQEEVQPQPAVEEPAQEEEEEIPALEALGKIIEQQKAEVPPAGPAPRVEVGDISQEVQRVLEEKIADLHTQIADMIRKEIERAMEEVDIQSIIRETAYKVLRERLEEIIS